MTKTEVLLCRLKQIKLEKVSNKTLKFEQLFFLPAGFILQKEPAEASATLLLFAILSDSFSDVFPVDLAKTVIQ